jgi:putative copper export protein
MPTAYNLFKFLHVAAAAIWVGGVAALAILNARVARQRDAAVLAVTARESAFYGRRVVGPAMGVVLLAGLAMAGLYHIGFTIFWIVCGFVGLVGSAMIGGFATARAGTELSNLATSAPRDESRMRVLQRQLGLLAAANLLLLFSVIWAMVCKPTL